MGTETPLIRYNLKERGRKHTGKPRNFNIRAIADAINSPACQEMVASRGMIGYYGHLPRVRYGMMPTEGGIEGGKYAPVEPAFVTTHLKADYDGNVEHRAEFLDTASGVLSSKLWVGKVGGFSSAIDESKPVFCGLDYVTNPNFLDNSFRGVVLDDALSGEIGTLTYDDVYAAEQAEQYQGMILLLDSLNSERALFNSTIERMREENEQLISMLVSKGISVSDALDSSFESVLVVDFSPAERLRREVEAFRHAELPRVDVPKAPEVAYDSASERIINRAMR